MRAQPGNSLPFLFSDFKSPTNSAFLPFLDGNGTASPSLPMDDGDLDSAALWAAVDSAAARATRVRSAGDDDHRGEVLQPARPFKSPRLASSHATPPYLPPPAPNASPFATPDAAAVRSRLAVVESCHPEPWGVPNGVPIAAAAPDGCLLPSLSVDNFRRYQEAALSILDQSDYTSISGNPYIKKSGWRKISCFFNISFEIKDHTIEFDENRNVNRAEFVVRASMLYVAGSQMVGAHVTDARKGLTNQTMTFPAQLKPELRTRLAS
ncbi:hypothetical protein ACP70R_023015 [Stipagrostis hirtigluma subsp. patula]